MPLQILGVINGLLFMYLAMGHDLIYDNSCCSLSGFISLFELPSLHAFQPRLIFFGYPNPATRRPVTLYRPLEESRRRRG